MNGVDKHYQAILTLTSELHQNRGTVIVGVFYDLLESLKVSYMRELADVKPENLQRLQGALKQVTLLQSAIESGATVPKI